MIARPLPATITRNSTPSNALPVISGDPPIKDQLLQQALGRLAASPKPGGPDADAIVTATRRLPAVAATYAPFPAQADDRLKAALAARGIEQLYTHQAEAFDGAPLFLRTATDIYAFELDRR